jgi:predicted DNA-binding protein (MmcQ/YjbR family)
MKGPKVPSPAALRRAEAAIRKVALGYPGAHEDFPWGHSAFKVGGKSFLFMALEGPELSLSAKLPNTGRSALALPFASPTGYGLGKSGWVTGRFGPASAVPLDAIAEWIDESYRAVAPKRVLQQLEVGSMAGKAATSKRSRKPGPRKRV